ncbi:fibronectin type III-like domain-contianing protein [Streptomyces sp. BBFR102]|uniref:fibronectin type III-like domain-contianing protein n=1 Tax=Streptomyces sp. BBFR102 TaxID=3448171 RepID=UPI003F52E180
MELRDPARRGTRRHRRPAQHRHPRRPRDRPAPPRPAAAPGEPERPAQRLAGIALAEAGPGESTEVTIDLPDRAFEIWDEAAGGWSHRPGRYELRAARSAADPRLTLPLQED